MATVKRVSRNKMVEETGMDTLGYTRPQNNMILVRDDLPKSKEKEVLGHEFDHLKNGEEGPFLGAVAGAVISGIMGQKSAKTQAGAVKEGSREAIAEQRRQYDLSRQDLAPYRQTGTAALNQIAQMYGLASTDTDTLGLDREIAKQQTRLDELYGRQSSALQNEAYVDPRSGEYVTRDEMQKRRQDARETLDTLRIGEWEQVGGFDFGEEISSVESRLEKLRGRRNSMMESAQPSGQADFSQFTQTPGYQFRVQEGEKGVQNYLGANNMRLSGRALKAMEKYRQGQASQEFGNYMNRMFGLAGIGQGATQTGVSAGQSMAGNVGNIMANQGGQLANIYGDQYSNLNNAFQGGLSNWTAYQQQQNMMNALKNNGQNA